MRTVLAAALLLAAIPAPKEPVRAQAQVAHAAAPADIAHFLSGTWQGDLTDAVRTYAVTMKLDPGGVYVMQHIFSGGFTILMRGRWSAEFTSLDPELGGSRAVISFEPTDSEPEEFCSAGIERNPVVVRDENTIVFGDGTTDYAHGVLLRAR
jgi:hypothetical protein